MFFGIILETWVSAGCLFLSFYLHSGSPWRARTGRYRGRPPRPWRTSERWHLRLGTPWRRSRRCQRRWWWWTSAAWTPGRWRRGSRPCRWWRRLWWWGGWSTAAGQEDEERKTSQFCFFFTSLDLSDNRTSAHSGYFYPVRVLEHKQTQRYVAQRSTLCVCLLTCSDAMKQPITSIFFLTHICNWLNQN